MRPNSIKPNSDEIWVLTNRCIYIKPKLFRANLTTGSQLVTSHLFEFDDNNHFQSRPKPSTSHGAIYPLTRPTWKHYLLEEVLGAKFKFEKLSKQFGCYDGSKFTRKSNPLIDKHRRERSPGLQREDSPCLHQCAE